VEEIAVGMDMLVPLRRSARFLVALRDGSAEFTREQQVVARPVLRSVGSTGRIIHIENDDSVQILVFTGNAAMHSGLSIRGKRRPG
jgi:hypothetical protein